MLGYKVKSGRHKTGAGGSEGCPALLCVDEENLFDTAGVGQQRIPLLWPWEGEQLSPAGLQVDSQGKEAEQRKTESCKAALHHPGLSTCPVPFLVLQNAPPHPCQGYKLWDTNPHLP